MVLLVLVKVGCGVFCGVFVGVGCMVLCGVVCGSPGVVDGGFSSSGIAKRLHNTITQQTTTSDFFIPFLVDLVRFYVFGFEGVSEKFSAYHQ